jgi:hypothetical protein
MNSSGIIGASSNSPVAAQGLRRAEAGQALAQGAVADLVVVLQEQHERCGRQVPLGSPRGVPWRLAWPWNTKPFGQAACQLVDRPLLVVGVVAFGFAGQQHVQGVVAVVVPLGVEALLQQRGLVVLVFQHQPDLPARRDRCAHALRQFDEEVRLVDGVHRIQAQAVAAVVAQPHQRVLDEVLAHRGRRKSMAAPQGVCRSSRKNGLAYWCR